MALYHIDPSRRGFAIDAGAAAGCPFCLARLSPQPAIGASITLLSGHDAGQEGVVTRDVGWRPGQFVVRMRHAGSPEMVVDPSLQLFVQSERLAALSSWLPPLSIDDAGALHESVLEALRFAPQGNANSASAKLIGGVVSACWQFRLPTTAVEAWAMLAAHGARPELRRQAQHFFRFGMDLLVRTSGRPPVKRRRMAAFSRGRYATKRNRELSLRHFGYE